MRAVKECAELALLLVLAEGFIFVGRCVEAVIGPFETTGRPACSKPFCYSAGEHEVDRWFGRGWVCSKHKRG